MPRPESLREFEPTESAPDAQVDSSLIGKAHKRIGSFFRLALRIVVYLLFATSALEVTSRFVHWGQMPLIPYYYRDGMPVLPSSRDLHVRFAKGQSFHVYTDQQGARISSSRIGRKPLENGVLVLGDSQALGYSLRFEETFGSLVSEALLGDADRASIIGSPASDIEKLCVGAAQFDSTHKPQELAILTLNLGNDLDEIFLEGERRGMSSPYWYRFLISHSFAFMDCVLIRQSWQLDSSHSPPGVNRVVFSMDAAERVFLARCLLEKIDALQEQIPFAKRTVILVLPSDYQVDTREFDKYEKYYDSEDDFEFWKKRIQVAASQMDAIQKYIVNRLEKSGQTVVTLQSVFKDWDSDIPKFEVGSHHLTAESHEAIARQIMDRLHESAP